MIASEKQKAFDDSTTSFKNDPATLCALPE